MVGAAQPREDGDGRSAPVEPLDSAGYFGELFRLQHELVKLQEWVQHSKLKVFILFEGRDSAGKGGVIKRIIAARPTCPIECATRIMSGTKSRPNCTFRPGTKAARRSARGTAAGTALPT